MLSHELSNTKTNSESLSPIWNQLKVKMFVYTDAIRLLSSEFTLSFVFVWSLRAASQWRACWTERRGTRTHWRWWLMMEGPRRTPLWCVHLARSFSWTVLIRIPTIQWRVTLCVFCYRKLKGIPLLFIASLIGSAEGKTCRFSPSSLTQQTCHISFQGWCVFEQPQKVSIASMFENIVMFHSVSTGFDNHCGWER